MTTKSLLTGALLLISVFTLQTATATPDKLPTYQTLRYLENWSVLKQMPATIRQQDRWNRIKYVPLSGDGLYWASFGGRTQYRGESWRNWAFGSQKDTFSLWHLLLHSDLHLGSHLRFFVEGKTSLASKRNLPGGRRTKDVDTLALQQGFVDIRGLFGNRYLTTVRIGRQGYSFGSQRLVSPLPWMNTLRTWDGITSIVQGPFWSLTAFTSRAVPVRSYRFNTNNKNNKFGGLYYVQDGPSHQFNVDAYWFSHRRNNITLNGISGYEKRQTIGTRFYGKLDDGQFSYDLEAANQFGTLGSIGIRAYMLAAQLSYQFQHLLLTPLIEAGYDFASGGEEAGVKSGTFSQLFANPHRYLGTIDMVGRQNIKALHAGIAFNPVDELTWAFRYFVFRRANTQDALYGISGQVVRAGNAGTSNYIGNEWDSSLTYQMNRHSRWQLAYSQFNPGSFIEQSGHNKRLKFAYLQFIFTV